MLKDLPIYSDLIALLKMYSLYLTKIYKIQQNTLQYSNKK